MIAGSGTVAKTATITWDIANGSLNIPGNSNDNYIITGGTYIDTLKSVMGYDSIVTLNLKVRSLQNVVLTDRVLTNQAYNKNGFILPPQPEYSLLTLEQNLIDHYGCDSIVTLHLTVYDEIIPDLYFSPNGDDVRDVWNIKNIERTPFSSIEIFDRFGKLLVRYTDRFEPWDGTYLGRKMPATDYWYVISLSDEEKVYRGHFTLIRR